MHLNSFSLRRMDCQNEIVLFLVEFDGLNIIENIEQMALNGVAIARLAEDFEQCWVGHEEETRECESFLLEVAGERFLAELQLLLQVGQQLLQRFVLHTTLHHVRDVLRALHYAHP